MFNAGMRKSREFAMKGLDQLDHDQRAALAANDPQRFEAMRSETLAEAIAHASAPNRPLLERMQWRIDQIRRLAPNPVIAVHRINLMMWEKVTGEGGLLDAFDELNNPRREWGSSSQRPSAEVVPFRRAPVDPASRFT